MDGTLVFAARLLVAALLGGFIGLQRELAGKPAGLRTNLLICLGSALFTLISFNIPTSLGLGDPARIAAQIVSGVGFLGAGTIIQSRHAVHGLTSAATIWVVAAVGMAVGAGFERSAALATAIILLALIGLGAAETRLLGQHLVAMTVRVGSGGVDPESIFSRLSFRGTPVHFEWKRDDLSGAVFSFSWRGTTKQARQVADNARALADVELLRWELED